MGKAATQAPVSSQEAVLDLVGVGFGPAGIAVAAAIEDEAESLPASAPQLAVQFLERAPTSAWQPNMLLPGTDIQHHFLRDFATPRNPRSRFTFPAYLVDTGRFYPFTLLGGYVSRQEWSDYVLWTAAQVTLPVRYTTAVVEITPVLREGRVVAVRVRGEHAGNTDPCTYLARNVVVSTGHQPYVPDIFAAHLGERVFHSADFLPRLPPLLNRRPARVAVIGAGQNAGEIVLHLAGALPDTEIHSLARNSGFRTYNLGHFANEAYFPAETDYFYALDDPDRQKVFDEVYSTNYACVDPDLSNALYRTAYEDRYWGRRRLVMRKRTAVESCAPTPGGGYRLALREVNTGAADQLDADVVILCTGFREPRLPAMLEPLRAYVDFDETGNPVVTRDFRLGVAAGCHVGLYLNGITEWRHGINTATSFSTMAIKAGEILRDIRSRHAASRATAQDRTDDGAGDPSRPAGRATNRERIHING